MSRVELVNKFKELREEIIEDVRLFERLRFLYTTAGRISEMIDRRIKTETIGKRLSNLYTVDLPNISTPKLREYVEIMEKFIEVNKFRFMVNKVEYKIPIVFRENILDKKPSEIMDMMRDKEYGLEGMSIVGAGNNFCVIEFTYSYSRSDNVNFALFRKRIEEKAENINKQLQNERISKNS